MLESFEISTILPTDPQRVYEAWLDGRKHGQFTGGAAEVDPRVGGRFTAWDGYIQGRTLELEPFRRIVQAWRSSEFPEGSADSRLEVMLEKARGGTRITIRHSAIPEGQGKEYEKGWKEHYFRPMKRYFVSRKGA
jgi:uncharacterized protein YndB with AHSA1/START domain